MPGPPDGFGFAGQREVVLGRGGFQAFDRTAPSGVAGAGTNDRRKLLVQVAAIGTGATLLAAARVAPSTPCVVSQADLKILDPVWTTLQLTQAHALMVYNQLFAIDSTLVPKPQPDRRADRGWRGRRHGVRLDGG